MCVCVCWLYLEGVKRRSSFQIFRGHHKILLRAALPASYRLNGPERLWHFAGKIETPLLAIAFWKLPVPVLVGLPLMLTDLLGFLKSQPRLV